MIRVGVVILNWNGWRNTVECLDSVFRLEGIPFRVVVCDNGSTDDSIERITQWAGSTFVTATEVASAPPRFAVYSQDEALGGADDQSLLTIIRIGANLGYAGGNNIGMRFLLADAGCTHVWILNNDVVVEPGALHALVRRMDEDSQVGMCGSTILEYGRRDAIQALAGGYYSRWIALPWLLGRMRRFPVTISRSRVERRLSYVSGATMLVSRTFLETVGLMSEDYFLYFEETDWALRSRGKFSLGWAPESIVYHKGGATLGTSSDPRKKSLLCDYYSARNRLFFTRRHYPYALPTVYVCLIATLVTRLFLGKWERVPMILGILILPAELKSPAEVLRWSGDP